VAGGTGADRQLNTLEAQLGRGVARDEAMKGVVDMLIAETVAGL
jgi:hypothetical protein